MLTLNKRRITNIGTSDSCTLCAQHGMNVYDNWWGARAAWGGGVDQEKEWMGCFLDDLRAFGINADQWTMTI